MPESQPSFPTGRRPRASPPRASEGSRSTRFLGRRACRATEHEAKIREILEAARPDLICLAGYMRVLSPEFVAAYPGRILNIHPSLLPKYPGLNVQRRALEAGDPESGCTVHYVEAAVDSGPILVQKRVPILPGDTEENLSARILEQEHAAYPEAVRMALRRLASP